jgi:hypothetical protein
MVILSIGLLSDENDAAWDFVVTEDASHQVPRAIGFGSEIPLNFAWSGAVAPAAFCAGATNEKNVCLGAVTCKPYFR